MKIGAVDLFCGVGGLTYGLQKAGINVVAGIDIDGSCKYAYEENNKSRFIEKSIDEVTGEDIQNLLSEYDIKVLVGCAPCQPFSSHNKNKYDRSQHKDWSLLYQFARIVKESEPDIISMENVPDLVKEKVFIDFVASLEKLNYKVEYNVINAAEYGVPQRRRRLILLAAKSDISLIEATNEEYKKVEDVIKILPEVKAGEKNEFDRLHITSRLADINLKRIQNSVPGGTWRDWPEELVLECHKKVKGESYSSVYGRMRWDDVAPTITTQFNAYGTGRFGHPEQDRALTLREGALLQTFPPNYQFVAPDEEITIKNIARHIGNAVPPRLGEVVGESILSFYSIK